MKKNLQLLACALFLSLCLPFSAVNAQTESIIDADQLQKMVKEGDVVLIDNCPAVLFDQSHIEGAINLPYFEPDHPTNIMTHENLLEAIGSHSRLVFYCSGRNRAYHAMVAAQKWGVEAKTYWFKDGVEAWLSHPSF